MAYANVDEVAAGFRALTADESDKCSALLEEAAVMIDCSAISASDAVKKLVSCRMVRRALVEETVPMGASQGTFSGLGYSQSWTMGTGGSTGELYISRKELKMLGANNRIGTISPLEGMTYDKRD